MRFLVVLALAGAGACAHMDPGVAQGIGDVGAAVAMKALDKPQSGPKQGPLRTDPPILTFGLVQLNTTQTKAIALANPTEKPIQITAVTISGDGYTLDEPTPLPQTLAPGGSFGLRVRFAPVEEHRYLAKLVIAFEKGATKQFVEISGGGTR